MTSFVEVNLTDPTTKATFLKILEEVLDRERARLAHTASFFPTPEEAEWAGKYYWSRTCGYECSSQGDRRFSAFYAMMPDGRTIEQHYQCDVKGYDPGGTNWKLGKGKPGLTLVNLWEGYLKLWGIWAATHQEDLKDLSARAAQEPHCGCLSDQFAKTPINQAHALSVILNELHNVDLWMADELVLTHE
jgi:hypothetical protein